MTRRKFRTRALIVGMLTMLSVAAPAPAQDRTEAFRRIRIGDADGFGFAATTGLDRPIRGIGPGPADSDGDGVLRTGEFLPDLNGDGSVWWLGGDNFDNRGPAEASDAAHRCIGCAAIGPATRGSNWTDLALSPSSTAARWPDADGPATPNNATFVFDFTVARDAIATGARIYFNLVFGDYDIDPAVVVIRFAAARMRILEIANQQEQDVDGLIQARTAFLDFDKVFTADTNGDWHGFVEVVFFSPFEPFTAFDFVELSLFAAVAGAVEPEDPTAKLAATPDPIGPP